MDNAAAGYSQEFQGLLGSSKEEINKIKEYGNKKFTGLPRTLIFIAMTMAAFFVIGMFTFQIVSGIAAIFISVIAAAIMYAGITFMVKMDPLYRMKLRNIQMEQMMKEARKRAVAQLENQVMTNAKRLQKGREAVVKLKSIVKRLESRLSKMDLDDKYREQNESTLAAVKKAAEGFQRNVAIAHKEHEAFEKQVQDYKNREEVAKIANEAMAIIGESAENKIEELLSLEAFEAIDMNFNSALAAIEESAEMYNGEEE